MTLQNVFNRLSQLIEEGADESNIGLCEDIIADSIDEALADPQFFTFPAKVIIHVVEKGKITSVETIKRVINGLSEHHPEEAPLIMNVIDTEEANLNDFASIMDSFTHCPLCVRFSRLRKEETAFAKDDNLETKLLKEENAVLKQENETNHELLEKYKSASEDYKSTVEKNLDVIENYKTTIEEYKVALDKYEKALKASEKATKIYRVEAEELRKRFKQINE